MSITIGANECNVQKLVRDPDSSLKIQFTTVGYIIIHAAHTARAHNTRSTTTTRRTQFCCARTSDRPIYYNALDCRLLWHIFAEADSFVPMIERIFRVDCVPAQFGQITSRSESCLHISLIPSDRTKSITFYLCVSFYFLSCAVIFLARRHFPSITLFRPFYTALRSVPSSNCLAKWLPPPCRGRLHPIAA